MAKATEKPAVKTQVERTPTPKYGDPGNTGIDRTVDTPWNEKKVAIVKAMRALKCFDVSSAASADTIAAKAATFYKGDGEIKAKNVQHYCYHLRAELTLRDHHCSGTSNKRVRLAQCGKGIEGIKGYGFWLTKEGQAIDPAAEFKAQEAGKAKAE